MVESAISTGTIVTASRVLTPSERLRRVDPDLADRMDAWETEMNRDYDLAATSNIEGVPPRDALVETEGELAFKLGRLALTLEKWDTMPDRLCAARDEAYMVLGRVEQLIAQRTLEAVQFTPQAALPPPSDPYDGGEATEDFHRLHPAGGTAELPVVEHAPDWDLPTDSQPGTLPTLATRVGGWWRRLRDHTRRVWAEVTVGMATWAPWGVG